LAKRIREGKRECGPGTRGTGETVWGREAGENSKLESGVRKKWPRRE